MAAITFPVGSIKDDAGALVTGATVTVASVKDKTGANVTSHGATVRLVGDFLCVDYDAVVKGEALITFSVSKDGSTFTAENAAPRVFCAKDSSLIGSLAAGSAFPSGPIAFVTWTNEWPRGILSSLNCDPKLVTGSGVVAATGATAAVPFILSDVPPDGMAAGYTIYGALSVFDAIPADSSPAFNWSQDGQTWNWLDVQPISRASLVDAESVPLPEVAGDGGVKLSAAARTALATQILSGVTAVESYSADGADATVTQLLYEIRQRLVDFDVSGNQIVVKKKDGTATAFTITMNSGTNPTSSRRTA